MYGHAKELWLEKFSEVRKKEETFYAKPFMQKHDYF